MMRNLIKNILKESFKPLKEDDFDWVSDTPIPDLDDEDLKMALALAWYV
jgi:hypothetical protein